MRPSAGRRMAESDKKLLEKIHDRFKVMREADERNRDLAMDDLRFLHKPGEQWDAITRKERGDRPCYEFNKLRIKVKRIVNEMRANRPGGKVRAVEDGDKDTAEVLEGLCRNIASVSDFDTICDYAGEYQVGGGMGAWRITTDYAGEDSFTQDILIEGIRNPFCLYADPSAQDPLKRDAYDWILTEKISKRAYEEKWPKAEAVSFEDDVFDDQDEWEDEERVRIAEYWWKEPYEKEIWLLKDGKVIDSTKPDAQALTAAIESGAIPPDIIVKKRMAKCNKIMMCVVSGDAVLTPPTEQGGSEHRFVIVYGEWVVVDGKITWFGLPRFAKDAQRSYNVTRTSVTETIATAPQSKFWATPKQAEGHLVKWGEAHKQNFPFLLYNHDPQGAGAPQRMGGPDVPVALIQEMQLADQELKDCTGVYDASLGERSNEHSGIAISRRAEQTQIVNFNFPDNMAKGVQRTWEILLDLIPVYYDTERTVRILGTDGAEKYMKVNTFVPDKLTGEPVKLNDLRTGKYDVTVTVGPSFSTQRQQAVETYGQLLQANPQLMGIAGDLIFKAMDLPYSQDIADRWKLMLPAPVQEMLKDGKETPPEVAQMMAQAKQAMQQVQQVGQMVQAAAAEATDLKTEAEKSVSDLKVRQAQFEADVIKEFAKIDLAKANLALAEAQAQAKGIETDTAENQQQFQTLMAQTVAEIQQMGAQFMQAAAQTMADIQAKNQPQVIVHSPPRPRVTAINRVNGQLIPQYEDQPVP